MTAEPRSCSGAPKKRRALLDIVADVRNAIDHADGEITDAVDKLDLELEEKIEACAVILLDLETNSDANLAMAKHFADLYKDRAQAIDNQATRLRERMQYALEQAGVEKLKTATCSVWFQESTSVEIADESRFMSIFGVTSFVRNTRSPDKTEIKKTLAAGLAVEGAKLVTTKHLRVR